MTDPGPRSPSTPVRATPSDDGTVLRPRGPASGVEGTVLRPRGAGQAGSGAPGDVWGATHLSPPPPGSWSPPAPPTVESLLGDDPGDRTVFAPHLDVPRAVFGSGNAGESRFAPPDERPGVPDIEPPAERFAPEPIPGGPTDLPYGGRFEAPAAAAASGGVRRRRLPRWLVATVGVTILALVAGATWWRFLRPTVVDPAIVVPTSAAPVDKPKVSRPDDAVRGYLEALRDGDIAKALSYGPVGPGSQVLLTPAAAREAKARAPIANVDVPAVSGTTSVVRARFTIGTEAVDRTFGVSKTDDGGWQLTKSTTTVQLSAKRSPRVPLLVNKQALDNVAVLELVPGAYHFETGLPFLRYVSSTDLRVQSLDYSEPIQVLNLELTDEGRAALLQQGQASMRACLEQPVLSPPNCPFGFSAPQQVTSIRWTQTKDPWPGAQFTLTREDAAVAEANFTISLNASVDYANGSTSERNPYEGEVRMTADITRLRAQDIQVRWSEARR